MDKINGIKTQDRGDFELGRRRGDRLLDYFVGLIEVGA